MLMRTRPDSEYLLAHRVMDEEQMKVYLTQSVFEVVLQKSILTQIRQLILYMSNSKGQVDGFVGKLTSAKRLCVR